MSTAPARQDPSRLRVERIDHIALLVRDPDASARWYIDLLGFAPAHVDVWWKGFGRFVEAGGTMMVFFPRDARHPPAEVPPESNWSYRQHFAMRVDRRTFEAYQKLFAERGIAFEYSDHTIAHSIYFLDPDGHTLELTTYEV
jgi:catechol 2,3-dioxygenase-like lactoylglutathione lyase family enzyme